MKRSALVIYHGGCADGMTAAVIAEAYYRSSHEVTLHPGKHGETPPDLAGYSEVCIVDFSYPLETMKLMLESTFALIVLLDHHKTAEPLRQLADTHSNFVPHIAMDRSGALIAWGFFADAYAVRYDTDLQPAPRAVKLVSKRDLWQHTSMDSADHLFSAMSQMNVDQVRSLIGFDDYTFDEVAGNKASWRLRSAERLDAALEKGEAICEYRHSIVSTLAKNYHDVELRSCFGLIASVRLANAPYAFGSEVGSVLLATMTDVPTHKRMAGYWFLGSDGQVSVGLRSEGADVSAVCQWFGGGGHNNAAGMRMKFTDFVAMCFDLGEENAF